MTTAERSAQEDRWRARPGLAMALRVALLGVPLAASSLTIWLAGRVVPADSWRGLAALLLLGLVAAVLVERGARRLLPVALLLKLSMVFPDQAPSRFKLARAAVARQGQAPTAGVRTRTSDLVLHLVGALSAHDRRSRGHSERVRVLSDMLAVEVGLDADSRDRLRWAALLHDVGKVEVPTSVLNKPGKLDRGEFDAVRLHPVAGAALAAPLLPWLGPWGEGIVDHHEKYDGSGYPAGKAGDEISLAGRMVGLVDAFETMTAARPYKKAMAVRAAREELARCAGTHFDPVLVRAFLAISLPRVLWSMGPLSFLLQLPFLRPLADVGSRTSIVAPQAAAGLAQGAAGAAGAAALVTGGVLGGMAGGGAQSTADEPPPSGSVYAVTAPQAAPTAPSAVRSPAAPALRQAAAQPGRSPRPATTGRVGSPSTAPAPAPAKASPAGSPAATKRAVPRSSPARPVPTRPPVPSASAAPSTPAALPDQGHTAITDGPPEQTASREATFTLVDGSGWECQVQGNGDGGSSAWRPCSGTFTLTLVRDGDHVLRVRDAASRKVVDTWAWTVAPA